MTHLLCSDRSVNAAMNLENKCYKPSTAMKGFFLSFFFFPLSVHIKNSLGIPLTVTIKKRKKKSESWGEPLAYFTLLFSLVPGAGTGSKRPDCDTRFSVQGILWQ